MNISTAHKYLLMIFITTALSINGNDSFGQREIEISNNGVYDITTNEEVVIKIHKDEISPDLSRIRSLYLLSNQRASYIKYYSTSKIYKNLVNNWIIPDYTYQNDYIYLKLKAKNTEFSKLQTSCLIYYNYWSYNQINFYLNIKKPTTPQTVLWLRSDKGTNQTNGNITRWDDQSGNNLNANSYTSNTLHENSLNYNPGVAFSADDTNKTNSRFMQVAHNWRLNLSTFSIFTVIKPISTNKYDAIVAKHSASYSGNGFGLQYFPEGTDIKMIANPNNDISNIYADRSATVNASGKPQLIGGIYNRNTISVFTESSTNSTSYNGNIKTNYEPLTLGSDHTSINNIDVFDGDINEVIIYDSALSNEEKEKTETYLAIKYGISLQHNYIHSNGTIIYTIAGNYNTDIAGISTDSKWELEQRISSSINTTTNQSSNITIATTNDFTSSNQNISRTSLSDGQALVWGKNNGDKTSWTSDGEYFHTAEMWKIQNTNNVGELQLQINLGEYPKYPEGYKYYILVDDNETSSDGIINEYELTDQGDNIYTTSINFNNGTNYISVGYKQHYDYGDAPNSYLTLRANNAPYHAIDYSIHLGAKISNEENGQASTHADADSFDDGVEFNKNNSPIGSSVIYAGSSNSVSINASQNGYVSMWIDYNMNGTFDTSEKVLNSTSVISGNNSFNFQIDDKQSHGTTFARIRYSTNSADVSSLTGRARNGEVEDYEINIVAAKTPGYCNKLINGSFEGNNLNENQWLALAKSQVSGWNINTGTFEIWNSVNGIDAIDGENHIELLGDAVSTIYQDVATVPGTDMYWSLWHRGRGGNESIEVLIGAIGAEQSQANCTTGTAAWKKYSGYYTIPAGQTVTRIKIVPRIPNSGTSGNFIDNVTFAPRDINPPSLQIMTNKNVNANTNNCRYLVGDNSLDVIARDGCHITYKYTIKDEQDVNTLAVRMATLKDYTFVTGVSNVHCVVTDEADNQSTMDYTVTVSSSMIVNITQDLVNDVFCESENYDITGNVINGKMPYTYNFFKNTTSVQSSNSITYNNLFHNGDKIILTVTDSYGCSVSSVEQTIKTMPAIQSGAINREN